MKKTNLFIALFFCSFSLIGQNNLLKNGSFEAFDSGTQLSRIAKFADYGELTQASNPAVEATTVVDGVWYRKSLNSAYLKATVVNTDAKDGDKSVVLSVNANSPQQNLNNWYTNTLVQFYPFEKKEYTIKLYAKSIKNASRIFIGIADKKGSSVSGSKFVDITPDWAEYTVTIKVGSNMKGGSLVIGLETDYTDEGKTAAGSVAIDNVQLY